jgi:hypothetical protein
MKSSFARQFQLFIAIMLAVGLFARCGRDHAERNAALAIADSLAAAPGGSDDSDLSPSSRPQDVALCELLAGYEAESDRSIVDSLLSKAEANPNCFCAIEVFSHKNRLLNKIPIVQDHVSNGDYVTQDTDPLELAVETGDWELVELLTQHGANLNGQGGHPNVLNDAIFSDNFVAVNELVELGADPKLASLARVGSIKMAEKMIALGCPAETIGLHAALRLQDRRLASFLVTKNPKPLGELNGDRLSLNEAEDWAFLHYLFELDEQPGVEIAWNAESFASQAVKEGDCASIKALAQRGLDLKQPANDESYVRDAVWAKRPDMVECLLALGAPANQTGRNAMESAIELNSIECIKILLKHKVKVENGSNLEFAREMGAKAEVLELLAE